MKITRTKLRQLILEEMGLDANVDEGIFGKLKQLVGGMPKKGKDPSYRLYMNLYRTTGRLMQVLEEIGDEMIEMGNEPDEQKRHTAINSMIEEKFKEHKGKIEDQLIDVHASQRLFK